jgi:hypothetical protein
MQHQILVVHVIEMSLVNNYEHPKTLTLQAVVIYSETDLLSTVQGHFQFSPSWFFYL